MSRFLSVWAEAVASAHRGTVEGIYAAEAYLKRPLTRDEIVKTLVGIANSASATAEGGVHGFKAQRQPEQPYLPGGPNT